MEEFNKQELVIWCKAKLGILSAELKRMNEGVAPDYVQEKDLLGNDVMKSKMIEGEINDLKLAIISNN